MTKFAAVAATSLALLAAAPAFAGGPAKVMLEPAPAVQAAAKPASSPWTGPWAGISLGHAYSNYGLSARAFQIDTPSNYVDVNLPELGGNGGMGGVQVGYNHALAAHGVWGVELDLDGANVTTKGSIVTSNGGDPQTVVGFQYSTKHSKALLARLGYLVNPNTLIYGVLGVTETSGPASLAGVAPSNFSVTSNLDLVGTTIGIGMETMITDKVSLKVDYQMTSFNRHAILTNQQINSNAGLSADMSTSAQAIHAAVVWHF